MQRRRCAALAAQLLPLLLPLLRPGRPAWAAAGADAADWDSGERAIQEGLRAVFGSMDADGSGQLEEEELVNKISGPTDWRHDLLWIMPDLRLTSEQCRQIFAILDGDRSGAVDFREFELGVGRLRGQDLARAHEAVQQVIAAEATMGVGPSLVLSTCMVGGGHTCPLSSLRKHHPSLVFPGGEARCLSDGDPLYAFRVYPGDTDKLYLDFQGGGACFNEYTTIKETMCKTNIDEHPMVGVYNKTDERNPFRNFTIVTVVYCSGDLHIGEAARSYGGIVQRGYANAKAAVAWAKANLDPELAVLAVGGCSAGALGAQLWAGRLLGEFRYRHAAVIPDSYLDLFPGRSQQHIVRQYGMCGTGLLSEEQQAACLAGNLTVHDLFEDAMRRFPSVIFGQVNSKYDQTQKSFHEAVAYTSGLAPEIRDGASYLALANLRLRSFDRHPNYVSFLVDGGQHCFTPNAIFYEATVEGEWGPPARGGGHPTLAEWVGELLDPEGTFRSECAGPRLHKEDWPSGGVAYCDAAQLPKAVRPAAITRPGSATYVMQKRPAQMPGIVKLAATAMMRRPAAMAAAVVVLTAAGFAAVAAVAGSRRRRRAALTGEEERGLLVAI